MPADDPAGTDEPDGALSTKTLLILIPLTVALTPTDAGWNSSVGALNPASHPAIAGISRARAPISRRLATVLPERLRITANASSVRDGRGVYTPVAGSWPAARLQVVEIVSVPGAAHTPGRPLARWRSRSGRVTARRARGAG